MAQKKVATTIKIQIPAGQATPAPPVGTALGPHGAITDAQCAEIAKVKMPDLNTDDLDQAKLQVAGTARSMGIKVE